MAKGYCLSVGVSFVDPTGYGGDHRALTAPRADALAFSQLAKNAGFEVQLLVNEDATSAAVLRYLLQCARKMQPEDLLLFYFSGDGSQVPDVCGDEAPDDFDETLCLYDRMLLDDELRVMWSKFPKMSRIVILPDCCHSGGLIDPAAEPNIKTIYPTIRDVAYNARKHVYDSLNYLGSSAPIDASIIQISACDEESAAQSVKRSLFTAALEQVWDKGNFQGTYSSFFNAINELMHTQKGEIRSVGEAYPEFMAQKPFTIEPPAPSGH
jgi:hypothetical protein